MKDARQTEYSVSGGYDGIVLLYDGYWTEASVVRKFKILMDEPGSRNVKLTLMSRPRGGRWVPILTAERAAA